MAGLIAAASLPVATASQPITRIASNSGVSLIISSAWHPAYQAWIYEFSSKSELNHYLYTELVSEPMTSERFEDFKSMALIQIEKMKAKL